MNQAVSELTASLQDYGALLQAAERSRKSLTADILSLQNKIELNTIKLKAAEEALSKVNKLLFTETLAKET